MMTIMWRQGNCAIAIGFDVATTVSRNVIKAVIGAFLEKCVESPTAQQAGGTAVSTLPKGGKG